MNQTNEIKQEAATSLPSMEWPAVTVIVATYNEERFISGCLDSILSQDYPAERIEILVLDGRSTDRTRAILEEYAARFPRIRVFDNPLRRHISAYNVGIRASQGEFILIASAHSVLEHDYVRHCVKLLLTREATNVGGVQRAVGSTYWGSAIALSMSCPFGVGDAAFRYSSREQYVDSVFGGAWRKETLQELGGFNDQLPGCEDYELNYRIRRAGGKILLSPAVRVKYFNRSNLCSLGRQQFLYAFQKPFVARLHPGILRWRHCLPLIFLLSLAVSVLLAMQGWAVGWFIPALYLAVSLVTSARIGVTSGLRYIPALPLAFATMHLAWGAGFIVGLFRAGKPHRTLLGLARGLRGGLLAILRGEAAGPRQWQRL